jgi:hypothetical protein
MHRYGYENSLKQLREQSDCVDKDQIVDGTGIGNDEPHT